MFELRLIAETIAELREKVILAATDLGLTVSAEYVIKVADPAEVPLPAPRTEVAEPAPKRRGRPPKAAARPVTPNNPETEQDEPRNSGSDDADDSIPEHMRDDLAPTSMEDAMSQLEGSLEGVEPYQDGEEVPEDVMRPISAEDPTETETAPPAEPEPATSEPATDASSDGPEALDSGLSADQENDFPPDFRAFIDNVESAETWEAVKIAMRDFYQSQTFKDMDHAAQNRVRANTAAVCMERKASGVLRGLPDQIDDLSYFRLWLEDQEDADAIKGTFATLQRSTQWKSAPEAMLNALRSAVNVRLEHLG